MESNPFEKNPSNPNNINNYYSGGPKLPKTSDWVIWLLLLNIPLVNIILLIIWSLDDSEQNIVRRNYCRANIIIILLALGITVLFVIFFLFIVLGFNTQDMTESLY